MPNYILYTIFFILLLGFEKLYFIIADRFNIIDHPNERSSHSEVTLLGGGIIFPIAVLLQAVYYQFSHPFFITGLCLISLVSFWDDIITASSKLRLVIHFLAVTLLFHELNLVTYSVFIVMGAYVLVIGIINAYNFMDGINGITGLYSITIISTLIFLNSSMLFVNQDILIAALLSLFVFMFFNFRKKARCFAGDVGSVSMAFIIIFALISLIIATGQFLYILFLAVYGVDSVLTIIMRILRRENIFEAHRTHVYQLLTNEGGLQHRIVSIIYMVIQIVCNVLLITMIKSNLSPIIQIICVAFALLILIGCYFKVRSSYYRIIAH